MHHNLVRANAPLEEAQVVGGIWPPDKSSHAPKSLQGQCTIGEICW